MAIPKNIKFISLDCYGTLIDWEDGIFQACKQEAERDGVELKRDEFMPLFFEVQFEIQAGSYELYAEVLRQTVVKTAKRIHWNLEPSRSGFLPDSVEGWKPFPEAIKAIQRVSKNYEIGLLSNIDDKLLGATRRQMPIDFDLVVTAQQVRSYKPEPDHFKECSRRVGGKSGWVHIASGYRADVAPCIRQRVPVIWVDRHKTRLEAKQKKPDAQTPNLTQAVRLILK